MRIYTILLIKIYLTLKLSVLTGLSKSPNYRRKHVKTGLGISVDSGKKITDNIFFYDKQ